MRGLTVTLCPFCCRTARAKSLPGSRVVSECNIDKKSATREVVPTVTSVQYNVGIISHISLSLSLKVLKSFTNFFINNPINIIYFDNSNVPRQCHVQNCTIRLSSRFLLEIKYRLCERSFQEFIDFFYFCTDAFVPFFFFFYTISRYSSLQ